MLALALLKTHSHTCIICRSEVVYPRDYSSGLHDGPPPMTDPTRPSYIFGQYGDHTVPEDNMEKPEVLHPPSKDKINEVT